MAGSSHSEHAEQLTASFGVPPTAVTAADDVGWIPAIVAARSYTIDVTRLGSDERVRVEVAPGAFVPTDLAAGDEVMIQGVEGRDGSIAAQRVIRGAR